jgi:hypothetical protein
MLRQKNNINISVYADNIHPAVLLMRSEDANQGYVFGTGTSYSCCVFLVHFVNDMYP